MAEYNHIEIMREEIVRQYKFHPNRNAPRPPVRNRGQHGEKLKKQLENSLGEIANKRRDIGIQSENLIVLELICFLFSSIAKISLQVPDKRIKPFLINYSIPVSLISIQTGKEQPDILHIRKIDNVLKTKKAKF